MTANHDDDEIEQPQVYELIYDVSERAKSIAPGLSATLKVVVRVLLVPGVLLGIGGIVPLLGFLGVSRGATGWLFGASIAILVLALVILLLYVWRLRAYSRNVSHPDFEQQVAQLVDFADMSDDFVERIKGVTQGGWGWKRIRAVWKLWRSKTYYSDRVDDLHQVRWFVPPRLNTAITIAVLEFWSAAILWGLFVVVGIIRLTS